MDDKEVGLLALTLGGSVKSLVRDGEKFGIKIEIPNPNPKYYQEPFIIIWFSDFGWEVMKSEK